MRYRPFGEPPAGGLDLSNLQLHAGVGLAHEIRIPYDDLNPFAIKQGAFGPAADIAIAWLPLAGAGWHAGIEANTSYARFAHDPGRGLSTAVMLVFSVDVGTSTRTPMSPHAAIARN